MLNFDEVVRGVGHSGFAIVSNAISRKEVTRLADAIASLAHRPEVRRRKHVYGVRNLLDLCQEVRELAVAEQLRVLAESILGPSCFAVFNKVPDANWSLRWHQDSVIAVRKRIDAPGFTAWSDKAGVMQVRPPGEILAEVLALRVHLDDSTQLNGPLRVLVGPTRSDPNERT